VTPEVLALRDRFGLPGMRILQFAFEKDARHPFLPHNSRRTAWSTPAPTTTTDARLVRGRAREGAPFRAVLPRLRRRRLHLGPDPLGAGSVADTFVAPLQDVLDLGSEARMNLPGRAGGNWGWRFRREQLTDAVRERLRGLTEIYGR